MKHPSPACRLMLVTPALAEMMLERNTHNRPTKSRHLKGLRHAAVEGHFMLTHQGIAFDSNGVLCDGQHRLRMISETEIGQYLFVFVGIDPEAFQYIDTHAKRSGSDTLATRGNVKYANNAAALARFIHVYDHYSPNAWGQAIVDNGDVAKTYDADPENMTWACAEASKTRIAHKGFSPNAIAGLIYLVRRQGATLQDIEDFLYGYRTGEDLRRGHPILALRREADKNRDRMGTAVKMKIQFGQWVMAWNATQEGRQMSALTHRLDDALPPLSIRK
jgi:hypothetical protein